jgi:hypothetical protein
MLPVTVEGGFVRRVTFRFNPIWATIGGVVISLGPALYVLDPKLKAVAVIILTLGVLLVISGLAEVSAGRAVVHRQWSHERILRALAKAPETATVRILQTWFPEEDFIDRLAQLYTDHGKRFHLRILLMSCDPSGVNDVLAARVRLRWIERSKAAADIIQTRDGLFRLKDNVEIALRRLTQEDSRLETVDLKVKFYDFMPFGPIYRIGDEVMFVGFYLNHASSAYGPMMEVRKKRSPQVWQIFESNFNNGWNDATPYYPPAETRELTSG